MNTNELCINEKIFSSLNSTPNLKIEFTVVGSSNELGSSSLIIRINNLPYGGYCLFKTNYGVSLETYFEISCLDWLDSDGYIERYEFYGKKNYLNTFHEYLIFCLYKLSLIILKLKLT